MRALLIRYHLWAVRRHASRLTAAELHALGFARDEAG
jgi:hypothetical protein